MWFHSVRCCTQGHFEPCSVSHPSINSLLAHKHPKGQSGSTYTVYLEAPYIVRHCDLSWCCPNSLCPKAVLSSDIVSLVPSPSGLSQAPPGNYIRALELIGVVLLWIEITTKPSALFLQQIQEFTGKTWLILLCFSVLLGGMMNGGMSPVGPVLFACGDSMRSYPYKQHTILNFHKL